jgi:creatinine amidohydrolase/Fe(II)-dependent formamide hydrolase-like protein
MKRSSIFLDECTDAEVAEYLSTGHTVLIPIGATEQHGPHDPLGTDTFIAKNVCDRLARRLGALVAPAISYGVSSEHRGFKGLSYVTAATLAAFVQDVCRSLAEVGFRRIILLNGHGSNTPALAPTARELRDDLPPDTLVIPLSYTDGLKGEDASAYIGPEVGFHANIGETSAVLAIDDSLVDMEKAAAYFPDFPVTDWVAAWGVFWNSAPDLIIRMSKAGTWGDPSGSTKELGEQFLRQIEDSCVKLLSDVEKLNQQFVAR